MAVVELYVTGNTKEGFAVTRKGMSAPLIGKLTKTPILAAAKLLQAANYPLNTVLKYGRDGGDMLLSTSLEAALRQQPVV